MTYAAAVSDPRIVDESMTSELFSGLKVPMLGFFSRCSHYRGKEHPR
jgi:hypothetical protein